MLDRQAVLGPLGCGLTIEVVVQNGFDGAVGARTDLQRSGGRGLHPGRAEGFDQPDDAKAGQGNRVKVLC